MESLVESAVSGMKGQVTRPLVMQLILLILWAAGTRVELTHRCKTKTDTKTIAKRKQCDV